LSETPKETDLNKPLDAETVAGNSSLRTISHYLVLKKLGQGGMAEVFLAEDTRLKRKVALKFLPAEFTTDKARLSRFQQEARAASSLNHPSILTVFDIGEVDSAHFIATEYVEGETLRRRIAEGPIEVDQALDIAIQVASALAAAHQAGIVHRDVKPENIMVRPDGYVKLLDFGIAKLTERNVNPDDPNAGDAATIRTEPGMVMGSPRYMSPEQVRGLDVDARTDIFSLGVVLYEVIARKPPFDGSTIGDAIVAVLQQNPAPLAARRPTTPIELQRIVTKALQKEREQRYQSMSEMLGDLKRVKQQVDTAQHDATTLPLRSALTEDSPTVAVNAGTEFMTQPAAMALAAEERLQANKLEGSSDGFPQRIKRRKIAAIVFAAAVLTVAGLVVYRFVLTPGSNQSASFTEAKLAQLLDGKLPGWVDQVFLAQDHTGGIGAKALDPSQGTQVWVTAQCLKGVLTSGAAVDGHIDQIKSGFHYIENLRRSEPDPGWNLYGDDNPYSITDIGAWVTLAEIASVESKTRIWNDSEQQEVLQHIDRDLKYLMDRQVTTGPEAGGWTPIKDQYPHFTRTYSTAMALWGLIEARRSTVVRGRLTAQHEASTRNAIRWLLARRGDSGWVPNPNSDNPQRFDGLTAQVLFVLSRAEDDFAFLKTDHSYIQAEQQFLSDKDLATRRLDDNSHLPDTDQHFPGTQFQAEGSTYLWFPWSVAELTHLAEAGATKDQREASLKLRHQILERNLDHLDDVFAKQFMYVLAESLFCISVSVTQGIPGG